MGPRLEGGRFALAGEEDQYKNFVQLFHQFHFDGACAFGGTHAVRVSLIYYTLLSLLTPS